MKELFTCYMSTGDIVSFNQPVSWSKAAKRFKAYANISHCLGRIYCGERFIRTTGDRWQDVPTFFDQQCRAYFPFKC